MFTHDVYFAVVWRIVRLIHPTNCSFYAWPIWSTRQFIIAYLKNLKFLDYRLIQPNELKDALDRYNGELQELDDMEKQFSKISSLDEKKMKEKAELEVSDEWLSN